MTVGGSRVGVAVAVTVGSGLGVLVIGSAVEGYGVGTGGGAGRSKYCRIATTLPPAARNANPVFANLFSQRLQPVGNFVSLDIIFTSL